MTATEELYDGLAETNYSGRLIAYVMEAMRTHSFDSKVLQDFIAEAEKRGARMTELKDSVFIKHIQNHLTEGQEVICKICNKSAEEIVATESGTLMAADKRYSEEEAKIIIACRDALAVGDLEEAYHQLYTMVEAKCLDVFSPWADLEALAQSLKPEGGE